MREKYQSIITADGWVLCGKCGHKLARVVQPQNESKGRNRENKKGYDVAQIQFKCHACKALNEFQ